MNSNIRAKKRGLNAKIPSQKEATELMTEILAIYGNSENYYEGKLVLEKIEYKKYRYSTYPSQIANIASAIISGGKINFHDICEILAPESRKKYPLLKKMFSKYDIKFNSEDKQHIKELIDFGHNMDYLKPFL